MFRSIHMADWFVGHVFGKRGRSNSVLDFLDGCSNVLRSDTDVLLIVFPAENVLATDGKSDD